ncbi:MAG: hypothetical protein IJ728_03185 [Selenomonadaceae bacterium]|nr:hypothetical protein [Selenomonadaceae bacterium]
MKTLTIHKALMKIEELLKIQNMDHIFIEVEKDGIKISSNFVVKDVEESEALGDED